MDLSLFGEDGKNNDDPGFKTPEFLKALERVRNLNELIPVKADDLKIETITQLEQNFIDGKTAYYFIGPWLIKTLKSRTQILVFRLCRLWTENR